MPDDNPLVPPPAPAPAPPAPTPPAPAVPPVAPQPPAPPVRTFTQEELDRIVQREKGGADKAALNKVLEQLGVTDLKQAADVMKAVKDADEATKTEAQRIKEAADQAKAEVDTARAELARERLAVQVERALLGAGVSDDAQRAELVPMVAAKVTPDLDVTAAVDKVKETFPALFAPAANLPPSGDPLKPNPPAPATQDAWSRGAARANAINEQKTEFDPLKMLRP